MIDRLLRDVRNLIWVIQFFAPLKTLFFTTKKNYYVFQSIHIGKKANLSFKNRFIFSVKKVLKTVANMRIFGVIFSVNYFWARSSNYQSKVIIGNICFVKFSHETDQLLLTDFDKNMVTYDDFCKKYFCFRTENNFLYFVHIA